MRRRNTADQNPTQGLFRSFQLSEELYRSYVAAGEEVAFDHEAEDPADAWIDINEGPPASIYGQYFSGYAFPNDIVTAFFDPVTGRWQAIGSGHVLCRGKLNGPIGEMGLANIDVEFWDEELDEWYVPDPPISLNVWDALDIDEVATDTYILATWHEQAQHWIATGAACAEEEA